MKELGKNILIGLSILLPAMISVQLIVWVVRGVESWLAALWLALLPQALYFPGVATITFLLIALIIGVTSRSAITERLWKIPGDLMQRIPLVRNIYGTIKDFLDLMGGKSFSDSSVVWVTLPDRAGRLLGIITREGSERDTRLGRLMGEDDVAVYLPMSYQAGGYMVVVPRGAVEATDMEPGEALQLIMSAGLGQRLEAEG
ncbi:MAG: DUF502 domain-containing protein [Pseudohongiellaceae bacterium]